MGCDIHLHTEVKIGGQWHHLGNPYVARDYRLFAKMANVRNSGPNEIPPLDYKVGIPIDATETTKLLRSMDGGNRDCWLDMEQLELLEKWYREENPSDTHGLEGLVGYILGNGWSRHNKAIEDARFIFWFYN